MLPGNFGELQYGQIWDKHRTSFVITAAFLFFSLFLSLLGLFLGEKKNQILSRLGHTKPPIGFYESRSFRFSSSASYL